MQDTTARYEYDETMTWNDERGAALLAEYHEPLELAWATGYMPVVDWPALKDVVLEASFGDTVWADALLDGEDHYTLEYVTCDGCDKVSLMWAFTQQELPLGDYWTLLYSPDGDWWSGDVITLCDTCSE